MAIVRTYDRGCEWCGSTGQVDNHGSLASSALYRTCPVCNGTGKVTVTETEDGNGPGLETHSRFSVYPESTIKHSTP
jgi:DnaJ-class molecular chaperone